VTTGNRREKITAVDKTNRLVGRFYGKYFEDSSIRFRIDKDNDVWDISIRKDRENTMYFNMDDPYVNVAIENSDNYRIALCAAGIGFGSEVRIFSKENAPTLLSENIDFIAMDVHADRGRYLEDFIDFLVSSNPITLTIWDGFGVVGYSFTIDTTDFAELYNSL
jgi:hypothetical protein